MTSMRELLQRIARLERIVSGMVRTGVVSSVDREKCRVRVAFAGNFVSYPLPVLVKQAGGHEPGDDRPIPSRDYWLPDVGEQVTCVFLPNGTETGFVIGSFYSNQDPIPVGADAKGMRMTEFADGARFEYSTEESRFRALVGELELEITPEHFRFGGESGNQPFVRGTDHKALIEALIDLIVAHTHPTGVGPSGPPANGASFTAKKSDIPGTLSTIIKGR